MQAYAGALSDAEIRAHDRPRDLAPHAVWRAALDELVAPLPTSPAVVDVGIGTGAYGGRLAARGIDVVGVDVNASMLRTALAGWPGLHGRVVRGDATRLPIASSSADLVVVAQVLHLVPAWTAVVDEIRRVLRPGGTVAASGGGGTGRSGIGRAFREALGDHPALPGASSHEEIARAFVARGFETTGPIRIEAEADQTRREFIDRLEHNVFAWHPDVDAARRARAAERTRSVVRSWGVDLDEAVPMPTGVAFARFLLP